MIPPYGVWAQMLYEAAHRRLKQSPNNVKQEIVTVDFSKTHVLFCGWDQPYSDAATAGWAHPDCERVVTGERSALSVSKNFV
jgi:hypothetical protein